MSRNCDDGCGEVANERLRYFTGRHMTARDFRDEQAYHRTHRYLHNRMLHGWGVVCGLHVHPHPNPECRDKYVKVDCGFALDCCGREIAVPKETVPPEIPWDKYPHGLPLGGKAPSSAFELGNSQHLPLESPLPASRGEGGRRPGEGWSLLLCLHYDETPVECVPVLYNEQNCDPQRREHSRVREGYRFEWHWVDASDLTDYHWKTRGGGCPDPKEGAPCIEDDCDDGDGPKHCCLEPQCPPHHCVPIALLRVRERGGPIEEDDLVILGRPTLEPPAHALTHICRINWPHGGVVTRGELEGHLRQLRVRFDRRLQPQSDPSPSGPTGVNACTFTVQFGGGYEDLDFVNFTHAPHVEHDCVAVFDIDPRSRKGYHQEPPYTYLENHTVFITLHCDFILDCHGVAVDGNHIGGMLPTGDGIAGGTFLSWFRVVPDRDRDHPYDNGQGHEPDRGYDRNRREKEQAS